VNSRADIANEEERRELVVFLDNAIVLLETIVARLTAFGRLLSTTQSATPVHMLLYGMYPKYRDMVMAFIAKIESVASKIRESDLPCTLQDSV